MFNWTGFHIGANIRRSWTRANSTDAFHGVRFGVGNHSVFLGGNQIGYHVGPTAVLGSEWLIDGIGSEHNAFIPGFDDFFEAFAREDFVTTLTGRVGFTAPGWDHWLVYVKGGVGWAQTQAVVTDLSTGAPFSTTNINGRWVAGLGLEWAFAPNWTARPGRQSHGLSGFRPPDGQPSHPRPGPPTAHAIASDTFDADDANAQRLSVGANDRSYSSPDPVLAKDWSKGVRSVAPAAGYGERSEDGVGLIDLFLVAQTSKFAFQDDLFLRVCASYSYP
jgi:hypothetical protein